MKPKVLTKKQAKSTKKLRRGRSPHPTSLAVCKLKLGGVLRLAVPKGREILSYMNTLSGLLRNKPSYTYRQGVKVSINQSEDRKSVLVTRRK